MGILAKSHLAHGSFKKKPFSVVTPGRAEAFSALALSLLVLGNAWIDSMSGFSALSRSGHFLLKDLILLAGTLLLAANLKPGNEQS